MKIKNLWAKYNHIWTLLYGVIYLPWFMWLEKHVTTDFFVLHMPLDDRIPFCEYFIIPYYLWFLFVPLAMGYVFFYSKEEYYKTCIYLFSGMTIFLLICTFWPNGLNLRQDISYRDNFCAKLVQGLYKTDTSTNVFPSLHVFNTLGCLVALYQSKGLKNRKGNLIKALATILGVFIILATMFLKQHSVWDVIGAFALAIILYVIVYVPKWNIMKTNRNTDADI